MAQVCRPEPLPYYRRVPSVGRASPRSSSVRNLQTRSGRTGRAASMRVEGGELRGASGVRVEGAEGKEAQAAAASAEKQVQAEKVGGGVSPPGRRRRKGKKGEGEEVETGLLPAPRLGSRERRTGLSPAGVPNTVPSPDIPRSPPPHPSPGLGGGWG
ncbi:B-cell lymphoma/leukemia 11B-like [Petaurus breviceps papuanus]|uniref:B-cell lymphoma/leukemia 11B-like n=1 Tax=Petaurus breviceps papuanus TaxID=3040969 RepID=UPI0036D7CC0E